MNHVAITGANGFLGRHLTAAFAAAGWRVTPLERPGYDLSAERVPDLAGVDVLIHCAHQARHEERANAESVNVAGSRRLFGAARASGVRCIVFISSLAAGQDAASRYGREKYAVEQLLDPARDLALRPGLVIGEGGLYAAMRETVRRWRIAPIVDGGRQPVYTVRVDELAAAAVDLVRAESTGTYLLAVPSPLTMLELYQDIARAAGVRVRVVRVPYAILMAAALAAERLGLRVPVTAENLRGIRNLRTFDIPRYTEVASDFR